MSSNWYTNFKPEFLLYCGMVALFVYTLLLDTRVYVYITLKDKSTCPHFNPCESVALRS